MGKILTSLPAYSKIITGVPGVPSVTRWTRIRAKMKVIAAPAAICMAAAPFRNLK
jgi:hypothetical protein